MRPLKIFLNLLRPFQAKAALPVAADDPFRHPDLQSMDLRQLADLPFPAAPYYEARRFEADGLEPPAEPMPLARCA